MLKALALGLLALLSSSAAGAEIRIVTANLPPFSIDEHPDKPGFVVELAEAAFKRAGMPYQLDFLPWARAQENAKTEPGTFILGLARTPEREASYKWVAEVLQPKLVFVSVKPAAAVDDLAAARKLANITVRASTPFDNLLKTEQMTNFSAVQSEEANAERLRTKQADAWLTYDFRAIFVWDAMGGDADQLVYGKPLSREHLEIAANPKTDDAAIGKIVAALAALRADGTYDTIYRRYFGQYYGE